MSRFLKSLAVLFVLLSGVLSLSLAYTNKTQADDDYWLLRCGPDELCGYYNTKGDTMIRPGKYYRPETDTFRNYAIMWQWDGGLVAINRKEEVLYEVQVMDNGGDYPAEGVFRMWKNGKMGYADARTGKVMLYPQYTAGFPFEKGVAKVSLSNCTKEKSGEYTTWKCAEWFYIDHSGKKVAAPK